MDFLAVQYAAACTPSVHACVGVPLWGSARAWVGTTLDGGDWPAVVAQPILSSRLEGNRVIGRASRGVGGYWQALTDHILQNQLDTLNFGASWTSFSCLLISLSYYFFLYIFLPSPFRQLGCLLFVRGQIVAASSFIPFYLYPIFFGVRPHLTIYFPTNPSSTI